MNNKYTIKNVVSHILHNTPVSPDQIYNRARIAASKMSVGKKTRFNGRIRVFCPKECRGNIKIGDNCAFNSAYLRVNPLGYNTPCVFRVFRNGSISIGDHVGASNSVFVSYVDPIVIDDYVTIGGGCKLYTTDFHPIDPELRRNGNLDKASTGAIHICENAWLGGGVMVLKGVTIGKNSVVGAGSVVAKDIPDNEIWAGNPAKFIRKIEKV